MIELCDNILEKNRTICWYLCTQMDWQHIEHFIQNTKLPLCSLNDILTLKPTDTVTVHDLDLTSRFRSALSRCRLLLSLAFCKALYSEHCSSSRAFFRWAAAWAMTSPLARLKRLLGRSLQKTPHVEPQLDVKRVKIQKTKIKSCHSWLSVGWPLKRKICLQKIFFYGISFVFQGEERVEIHLR